MKQADTQENNSAFRKAIEQKFGHTSDVPEGFTDNVMKQVMAESNPADRQRKHLWPWFSATAIALVLLTITFWPRQSTTISTVAVVSENMEDAPKPQQEIVDNKKTVTPIIAKKPNKVAQTVAGTKSNNSHTTVGSHGVLNENVHYASCISKDTLTYQAPFHMEDFIRKLADYNHVKGETLDCTSGKKDTAAVSIVFVFEDRDEQNLFGRLLQAACWYDDKTPGYLLNYSHQQFFFHLKDMRLGLKYLWIAERVNGKILLYSTHSPIDTETSSECFREYRDKLTNTSIHQKSIEI